MLKWKRKFILYFGGLAVSATALGTVVSCADNPNSGIQPDNKNRYAYTIYFQDGTHEDVDYNTFLQMISDHQGTPTDVQVGFDNQLIKYLYDKEQAASIIANDKDSSIAKLEARTDVYTDATNQLNTAKASMQKQYGVNWQEQWSKALLSTQYGGATSEDQAIEYLAIQKMKSDALRRYTLKIDTSTYKATNIGNQDYPFLKLGDVDGKNYGNAIPDRDTKNADALITTSFDDKYKSPDHLISTYMNEYKSATVIRHLLYAIKAGAKATDHWTVTKDTLKKIFAIPDGSSQVWDKVMDLGTSNVNWVGNDAPANSLIQNWSDDGSEGKSNGSLSISSGFDSVNTLVPGFAIPIGLQLAKNLDPSIPLATPTGITGIDFNGIVGTATGKPPGYRVSSLSEIDDITDQQLVSICDGIREAIAPKTAGSNIHTRPLYMTIGKNNMPAVFSVDGLHFIHIETATSIANLYSWVYSDLSKTKQNQSLEYKVSDELNKKFTPDTNLTSAIEDLKGDSDFLNFAQTQKNYADSNDANFTTADINNAVNITEMLHDMDKETSIQSLQKKYATWWDTSINKEPLVDPGAITLSDIKDMIRVLGGAN